MFRTLKFSLVLICVLIHSGCTGNCPDVTVPQILRQPQSQSVTEGEPVTFRVESNGFAYQWKKDGVDLAREITTQLVIPQVAPSHAGNYTVVITNDRGGDCGSDPKSVTSTVAILTVMPKNKTAFSDSSLNSSTNEDPK